MAGWRQGSQQATCRPLLRVGFRPRASPARLRTRAPRIHPAQAHMHRPSGLEAAIAAQVQGQLFGPWGGNSLGGQDRPQAVGYHQGWCRFVEHDSVP